MFPSVAQARGDRVALVLGLTNEELTAITVSLGLAAVATLVSLPCGIAVAILIGRGRFLGRPLLNALVLLTLVLPQAATVMCYCYYSDGTTSPTSS